ncbi:hypothetical protein BC828DRAFT_385355 [Blastocladiella britannica]|nr:hypothetical protein BC828DRAFT_385355 [Blastocladiella britannica]
MLAVHLVLLRRGGARTLMSSSPSSSSKARRTNKMSSLPSSLVTAPSEDAPPFVTVNSRDPGSVLLHIHVKPGAKKTQILGIVGDRVDLQIAAPPRDGEANDAVVLYVASLLGARKSDVVLARGQKSREKSVSISGTSLAAVADAVHAAAATK